MIGVKTLPGMPTTAALALIAVWFAPSISDFLFLGIPMMVRLYATAGRRHALRLQAAPGNA